MSDLAAEYLPTPEDETSAEPKPEAPTETTPSRPGVYDPLAGDGADAANPQPDGGPKTEGQSAREKKPRKPLIEFYSPSQLKAYMPPEN